MYILYTSFKEREIVYSVCNHIGLLSISLPLFFCIEPGRKITSYISFINIRNTYLVSHSLCFSCFPLLYFFFCQHPSHFLPFRYPYGEFLCILYYYLFISISHLSFPFCFYFFSSYSYYLSNFSHYLLTYIFNKKQ